MLVSFTLAIIIGGAAASRPDGVFDVVARALTLISASLPEFWVGLTAVLVFSLWLGWLPTSGMGPFAYWIMPVLVLALRPLGLLTQIVRSAMLSSLASPYIKTAMAKGAGRARIVFVHALRNSLLPVITVAADRTTALINGAVVVETIFGWPGIGSLMITSIKQRDFAVVQATIIVTAIGIILLNVVIDIIYTKVDPRIRISGGS